MTVPLSRANIQANTISRPEGQAKTREAKNAHAALPFRTNGKKFTNPEEAAEFPVVVGRLEAALRGAFSFDKINYLCLMMVDRHYHFHVIPRYETPRSFDGAEFTDEAWPRFPTIGVTPSDEAFLIRLRDHLRGFLPES